MLVYFRFWPVCKVDVVINKLFFRMGENDLDIYGRLYRIKKELY